VDSVTRPLTLTDHPQQRAGAWAVAIFTARDHPHAVTEDDLDQAARRLVRDLSRAATTAKTDAGYDWWKVQFALYPNSKVTHAKRPQTRAALEPKIAELFIPDPVAGLGEAPCVFCDKPSTVRWAKRNLPLFDAESILNNLPPGLDGWPVCQGCRIAVWALPYGAAVTAGSASVLTSDSLEIERKFAKRNVDRASKIMAAGFAGLSADAKPEAVAVSMLSHHHVPLGVTLWMFKNDNQEPWLRVTETRQAVTIFLRRMHTEPAAQRGWKALIRLLTNRDAQGNVKESGHDQAAKTLFEPAGQRRPRLLETAHALVQRHLATMPKRWLRDLTELAHLYSKEMLDMDPTRLKPVADLIASWIAAATSPRGRFNEYVKAAGKGYPLGGLLMQAEARLLRNGQTPPMKAADAQLVVGNGPGAWEHRMLLFFSVVDALIARGVEIGSKAADEEDNEIDIQFPEEEEGV